MSSVATVTITLSSKSPTTQGVLASARTSTGSAAGADAWNPYFDNPHSPRKKNQSTSSTSLQSPSQSQFPFDRVSTPSPWQQQQQRRTPREPTARFRPPSKEAWFRQEERVTFNVRVANAILPAPPPEQLLVPAILLHDLAAVQPLLVCSEVMLFGHCRVANLSFEKQVLVRCTTDAWETYSDIEATYHDSVPTGGFDLFSFKMMVDPEKEVELALRYLVNKQEYWDNNNGKNYRFSLEMKSEIVNVPVEWTAADKDDQVQQGEAATSDTTRNPNPVMWSQKRSALSNYTNVDPWLASAYWRSRDQHRTNQDNASKRRPSSELTSTDLQTANVQDDGTISPISLP